MTVNKMENQIKGNQQLLILADKQLYILIIKYSTFQGTYALLLVDFLRKHFQLIEDKEKKTVIPRAMT